MVYEWTTEIDIKQDNVLEIPVTAELEGEMLQGDHLRVRVIVEEVLFDSEEEEMLRLSRKSRWENEGGSVLPWQPPQSEPQAEGDA